MCHYPVCHHPESLRPFHLPLLGCVSPTFNLRRQITFPSHSGCAAWNDVLDGWRIPRLFILFFFLNASLVIWQGLHFNSALGFCLWKELAGTWTASLTSTVIYSMTPLPPGMSAGWGKVHLGPKVWPPTIPLIQWVLYQHHMENDLSVWH